MESFQQLSERADSVFQFTESTGHGLLWNGNPFVIVGTADYVASQFESIRNSSPAAERVFDDHGYFWAILTDKTFPEALEHRDRQVLFTHRDAAHADIGNQLQQIPKFGIVGLSERSLRLRQQALALVKSVERAQNRSDDRIQAAMATLILGESGAGKSEIAAALGRALNQKEELVKIDCGGVPDDVLMSELFGHVKGAFTDAANERRGLLRAASGKAMVLNDLDSAPQRFQAALLGYLDTGQIRPVGSDELVTANAMLIFTTNTNLRRAIQEGRFREDFVYRAEERILFVPPLRERPADIPALCHSIWSDRRRRTARLRPLDSTVIARLCDASMNWTGNVRSLRALLSLVASLSAMRGREYWIGNLVEEVLQRGNEVFDWVGLVEDGFARQIDSQLDDGGKTRRSSAGNINKWNQEEVSEFLQSAFVDDQQRLQFQDRVLQCAQVPGGGWYEQRVAERCVKVIRKLRSREAGHLTNDCLAKLFEVVKSGVGKDRDRMIDAGLLRMEMVGRVAHYSLID